MRVVYNGVDTEAFSRDPGSGEIERGRLGLRGPVVGYVGRMCEQKGTHTLLDAFARLKHSRPDAELVLVGPIEDFVGDHTAAARRWESRMEAVGGRYLGAVHDERLRGLYNLFDVFVMPTLEHEMFGMATAEAQACGTPAIVSDHGGLPEVAPHARRFRPGDASGLAEALEAELASGDTSIRGSEARNDAERFAWAAIADELEDVYLAVNERRAHRGDDALRARAG
jgi:glycosyltransferase involved in cell wall biosynthesis